MKPDVTVLMPVYNGERYLRPAIDSVLSQSHDNFELVIVDDGSSDGSAGIVASYADSRIRSTRLAQNAGLSVALNEGLRMAEAPLIARQDQDDVAEPHRLERQLAFLRERPEVALLGSQAMAMTETGRPTGTVRRPVGLDSIRWFSLFDNPFIHSSVVFRTDLVREGGGYNPAYDPFSQDYELWCRIMERHTVANLAESLVRFRVSESSITGAVRDDDPDGAYQRRFDAVQQELAVQHARRLLGDAAVTNADGPLLAGIVRGLAPDRIPDFLALFERLLGMFRAQHGAARSADFGSTLARQFDALAFRMKPSSRLAVLSIYSHLLRYHPELVTHVSWLKTAGMMIVGKSGRERIGRWRRT